MVVIIPLGNVAQGRLQRRLQHAGLGVEGGERSARAALRRLQRRGGRRRLEGRRGRRQPAGASGGSTASSPRPRRSRTSAARGRRASPTDGTIAATSLRLTALPWDVPKESGEKLIALAEKTDGNGLEIKLGGDPIYAAAGADRSGGVRLSRRHDRAPDRLRLGRRRRPAARDRPRRSRDLRRADRAARDRRRRPRLDDRGLGTDRHRGRDRLLAAGPDAFPLGADRRQEHARCAWSRRSPPRAAAC